MTKIETYIKCALALAVLLLAMINARAAGVSAPHFDLPGSDGKRYTDSYLIGQPTLVVFWASWCPVCQVELPKLRGLYEETKGKGLRVLAIGFADSEENIRNYVKGHPDIFDFPSLYDPRDGAAKRFGVFGTPTIYLVNTRGEIEYVTWLIEDPTLKQKLETLLDARSTALDLRPHFAEK